MLRTEMRERGHLTRRFLIDDLIVTPGELAPLLVLPGVQAVLSQTSG